MSRRPLREVPRKSLLGIASAALAALVIACGGDSDQIVFMAGSQPEASLPLVAVYVADAEGFYEAEGLTVEIRHSTDGAEHLRLLERREIHFTTSPAAELVALQGASGATGEELRAVVLFGQRGDNGYVVRSGSGIANPAQFAGMTVGTTTAAAPPELLALLAGAGLSASDITLEQVESGDIDRFMTGEIDVYPVSISQDPDTLRRQGFDVTVIDPHDFGVATLGVVLAAHERLLAEDPELAKRFLRATLRGALFAAGHIDEAIDVALTFAAGADPDHQSSLLEMDLSGAARADGIGRASAEQWQEVIDLLVQYGGLERPVDAASVFDGSIVDSIYDNGHLD